VRDRRRRRVTWVVVISLVVVLVIAVAVPLLLTSSPPSTVVNGVQILSANTLLSPSSASAVAMGDGAAFVADDRDDLVTRFDPATGQTEDSAHLTGRPTAMVFDDGDLWVAERDHNLVVQVDAYTMRIVGSLPVPAGPSSLAVLGGAVWVASSAAKEVTPIEVPAAVVGIPIDVLAGVVQVAAGYGALWVTGITDLLTRIVPLPVGAGGAQQRVVRVGQGPTGVATGFSAVWVADSKSATVSKVDPADLNAVTLVRIGGDPNTIAVAEGRVYVGFGTSQQMRLVSPTPGSEALGVGTEPRALLPVGPTVWVAGTDPGRVLSVSAPGLHHVPTG
jgi:hypothetical protein